MPSEWLAVEAATDLRARARQIQRSWESLLAGGALTAELPPRATAELRPAIVDSWRRSLATGLDPTDLLPSIEADPSETRERWLEHPLGSLRHVLAAHLQRLALESNSLVQVTDPSGLTLHLDGPEWLKARAAEMNLVEGARCAETVNGTNGVGTALAADHAVQVFAFEHFSHHHREWVCSGSPVHDPVSGRLVGVLDLSSPWKIAHPRSLELVTAAATTLEQCLLETRRQQDARLRRRYCDLVAKSTDLLVNGEGYVLVGGDFAWATPLDVPAGGGEIVMSDGSLAVAEPLGQGEAYLVRRLAPGRVRAARPGTALGPAPEHAREHVVARDGSAAEQTERHLRELADEQAALRRVATLVARESSPQRLFASVAEQVARIIDVPLVRLVRYETDGSAAELIGGWAETVDSLPPGTRWPLERPGVLASVWRTGLPARRDFTEAPEEGDGMVRQAWMRSAVACPITVEGRLWGAIAVLSPRREPLAEGTEARLADFTELIATAISNTEARDGERRLAEEQAALRRVAELVAREASQVEVFAAVADAVSRLLGEEVRMVRYEVNDAVVVAGSAGPLEHVFPVGSRVPLGGNNAVSRVLRTGKPVRIDDYREATGPIADTVSPKGLRSTVATPIVVGGRLWGTMVVASFRDEPIAPRTESRLAQFTELVATALANAESRAELAGSEARARKLAEKQAALRRIATLVAHESSPDEIFAVVAEEVGRVIDVPLVALARYEPDGSAIRLVGGWGEGGVPIGGRYLLDGPSSFLSVWQTRSPARTGDSADLPGEIAAARRQAGLQCSVASPILVDGRLWGVISVASSELLPEDTDVRLLDFTELLATAIANSEARAKLRRLVDEQAALRRVATLVAEGAAPAVLFTAVTDEVAGLFEPAAVTLSRYEADVCTVLAAAGIGFEVGSRWPLDVDSLAARVHAAGRPVHVADYTEIVGASPGDMWEGHPSDSDLGVPIVVDGTVWGVLCVATPDLDRNPSETAERIGRFTELVATAVSNATIRSELAASRARVIAAADETRRRIERDLHDGAQQQLVTLALGLRFTEERVPAGLDELRTEVGEYADRLASVIEELREMSRGIHPAILTESGLTAALRTLARRSAVPVALDVRCDERLPDPVEVAAYYVVSEALTNAAKHARASLVRIDVCAEEGVLRLSILDDGVGGADPSGGSGLVGLEDRVEALGGTIEVDSPSGGGTRLDVAIPVTADSSTDAAAHQPARV
jgi:signal transduction histidine kinase